jgi:dipeptidyl aminopeptidase/acylaminoacyl peptidase
MTSRAFFFCVSLLLGVISPVSLTAKSTIPDYIKRAEISSVSMSEDGRFVSFLSPKGKDNYDLNIYDSAKAEAQQLNLGGDDVLWTEWIDATRMVVATSNPPSYYYRLSIVDVANRKRTDNLNSPGVYFQYVSSLRRNPKLFCVYYYDEDHLTGLAVLNAKVEPHASTIGQIVNREHYNVSEWIKLPPGEYRSCGVDADGEIRAVQIYHEKSHRLYVRPDNKSEWKLLPYDPFTCSILGYSDDTDLIYLALYAAESRSSRLHRYRISTSELSPPIYEDPEYSVLGARLYFFLTAEGKRKLAAIGYERDFYLQRAIDAKFAEIQKEINRQLPGRLNIVHQVAGGYRQVLFSSANGREPERYALFDPATQKIALMPDPAPWIDPKKSSVQRALKFTTRDGLKLEGYLSLPTPSSDGKKPALIVYPHGGPWHRDTWGYTPEVQFLTSLGYAVFQPNYRGSTGYSKAVSIDQMSEFRKMHDDVTDGLKHILTLGQVDPERIAIYGGSFGGYLAICGAAYEPGLYRCAITWAGVFDWKADLKNTWAYSHGREAVYDLWRQRLGDPKTEVERFNKMSPIHDVGSIKCPVLVGHGGLDFNVSIDQSTKLLKSLAADGVPHEHLLISHEGHSFSDETDEERWLATLEKFLAKHLN